MSVEISTEVAKLAVRIAELLETMPENKGDVYVTKVTFGFHGDPYEGFSVEPNEFDGYSLKIEEPK